MGKMIYAIGISRQFGYLAVLFDRAYDSADRSYVYWLNVYEYVDDRVVLRSELNVLFTDSIGHISEIKFTPDASYLYVGYKSTPFNVFKRVDQGYEPFTNLKILGNKIYDVAVSADKKGFISTTYYQLISYPRMADSSTRQIISNETYSLCLALSDEGDYLAVGGWDIQIYHLKC